MIIHDVENLRYILGFDEAHLLLSKKSKLIRCYLSRTSIPKGYDVTLYVQDLITRDLRRISGNTPIVTTIVRYRVRMRITHMITILTRYVEICGIIGKYVNQYYRIAEENKCTIRTYVYLYSFITMNIGCTYRKATSSLISMGLKYLYAHRSDFFLYVYNQ